MNPVVVDPEAMKIAIPAIEGVGNALVCIASELGCLDVPAGVPAGLRGHVERVLATARQDLISSARDLAAIPPDLQRRVSAAQIANAGWALPAGLGTTISGLFAGSFAATTLSRSAAGGMAAREVVRGIREGERYTGGRLMSWRLSQAAALDATSKVRGLPGGVLTAAKWGSRVSFGASVLITGAANINNPYLSTTQKVTRTGASVATAGAVSFGAGAAAGATLGSMAGPVGLVAGAGAGAAWSVVDAKLGVSDKIGDAAAGAADTVAGGAKKLFKGIGL